MDIDGDERDDDALDEDDIDGDGRDDDHPSERDIDGDGRDDDDADEDDIDGDGHGDDDDDDIDGDGHERDDDDDDDGDGRDDDRDHDDDGDDIDDDDDDVVVLPGGSVNGGVAPASLTVLAVSKNSTDALVFLNFDTATTGVQNEPAEDDDEDEDHEADPFDYLYTPNGATATLRVTFKPGKYDDYALDFATGTFVRTEYDDDDLKDTDEGTFTTTPPVP